VIALGLPPEQHRSTSGKTLENQHRYITSDLNFSYHHVPEGSPEDIMTLLKQSFLDLPSSNGLELMTKALQSLDEVAGTSFFIISPRNYSGLGETHPELKPSYRHALILSAKFISTNYGDGALKRNLRLTLENTFLIRYLPGVVADLFDVSQFQLVTINLLRWP
jgi:hypothetical protein